jgi:erythritol kinase
MSRDIIIGIDAGTTVIKSVAFDTAGHQIGMAGRPNVYESFSDGRAEQDMARTWQTVVEMLRELAKTISGLDQRVAAIAVTAQGDGTWLVNSDGEPVAPALLWLDARAADIARDVIARPDYPDLFAINATGANPCQQSAQLAWFKRNRPEYLARTATAMHCKDWLYFKMTGVRATDPSEGTFTFGDFRTREYSPAILDAFDIADLGHLLPPMVDGVDHAEPLSASAADQTGLREGTPVVLGYIDVVCSSLGGGLFDPDGRVGCSILGSTGIHMRLTLNPADARLNDECSGYTIPFPYGKACIQMQSNMAAAINIDWIVDVARDVLAVEGIHRSRSELLEAADARIKEQTPGRLLYHPYISPSGERGPFMEPAARAGFIGIDTGTGYFALMRAVYEGMALAARDCYTAIGPLLPSEIMVTGGAARSSALRRILSDILGARVRSVSREEAGAAGASMIAAVQTGCYADMTDCARDWVSPYLGAAETPRPDAAERHSSLYHAYRKAREALRPVWQDLAAATKRVQE